MKILLVADGRSPITRGWVNTLRQAGLEVSLVSTFPCPAQPGEELPPVIPVAFSSMAGSQAGGKTTGQTGGLRKVVGRFRNVLMAGRYWLGPLSLKRSRDDLLRQIDRVQPDVVHALRIPFEGMLARVTPREIPFVVSIWGNDLTLHAHGSPLMADETRLTLQRVDGLLADAHRDLRLAAGWGLRENVPTLCVPGGGGIDRSVIKEAAEQELSLPLDVTTGTPLVFNPRGFRPGSVRNDTFFKSIPLVLKEVPDAVFVCAAMAGQSEALDWNTRLGIEKSVRLLPFLAQEDVWRLFHRSQVSVSISRHDGTPNSLLEAMALGCYPVAGDIESTREWITDGKNGRLINPADEIAAAQAIMEGLQHEKIRKTAASLNDRIIAERADRSAISASVLAFYRNLPRRSV